MHQRTSYSTTTSPYPEAKQRPIAPGAFAEPYMHHNPHHPQSKAQMRRSMISLNADSGYMGGPDSERLRQMRGSRMSLNQIDFEPAMMPPPRILIPPDAKTLKKLEKMEKKHQKLMKKLGARGIPIQMPVPPPPPMHPMYSRAISYDDLHRMHEAPEIDVRMRQRDWRTSDERRGLPTRRETQSQYVKHNYSSTNRRAELNGSLASSSPMTSSEEGGHSSDPWNTSSISSGKRDIISPPMYSSTPHHHNHHNHQQLQHHQVIKSPQPPITKTIEVKVERSEKVEQQVSEPTKRAPPTAAQTASSTSSRIQHNQTLNNSNATYAQPIIRRQPSYGSRSSSIATSQMRCDQSEIDFSWVNEEEDKLKRESKRIDSLPEFYFGMDPPPVPSDNEKENDEKRNRRKSSVLEKTAAFEIEARRNDRKEPSFLSRSSHQLLTTSEIPPADYSPLSIHTKEIGGPAERRIYRIQKQQQQHSSEDRRYRSSIAF